MYTVQIEIFTKASFSENKLVVPTGDQVDEQQNRRVEIRVAG